MIPLGPYALGPESDSTRAAAQSPRRVLCLLGAGLAALVATTSTRAQENHIDTVTPFAPELAHFGPASIGVRTLSFTERHRADVLHTPPNGPTVYYDRKVTVEVWYPAVLAAGQKPVGDYRVMTRNAAVTATLHGQAVRDAAPAAEGAPYPLVILSHGYPGNRFLLSHLGENLASKGYIVAAIDHPESTYDDIRSITSTMYNRPLDQLFVLDEMDRLGGKASGSFLAGLIDAKHTGLVGYSMGAFGALNVIGAGFSRAAETDKDAPPNQLMAAREQANPEYQKSIDPRIVAAVVIAPWGLTRGFWDDEGLQGIHIPVLFVAGSLDTVAGYEKGPRAIYQRATHSNRYLLTYINGSHNAAGPIPAPVETLFSPDGKSPPTYTHYADPVWDTVRMNNILDHFVTAFFGAIMKHEADKQSYLDVPTEGAGTVDWKGFKPGTTGGLKFEHAAPAP